VEACRIALAEKKGAAVSIAFNKKGGLTTGEMVLNSLTKKKKPPRKKKWGSGKVTNNENKDCNTTETRTETGGGSLKKRPSGETRKKGKGGTPTSQESLGNVGNVQCLFPGRGSLPTITEKILRAMDWGMRSH